MTLLPWSIVKEELIRQEGIEPLTDRELQILRLLDKDLMNKKLASQLVVPPGTVKVHTNNAYRKLSKKHQNWKEHSAASRCTEV